MILVNVIVWGIAVFAIWGVIDAIKQTNNDK
jgi:hypothetical protein